MNKYDIISEFLLTGNFIESSDYIIKGPITSLSDYLIYQINILQDINLYDTIDYQNFLMVIKDNIEKLNCLFFILNQIEYYKLLELNRLINYNYYSDKIYNNYKFNSIIINNYYFDFNEIVNNFNNYRENIELNYSKLIYFSNINYCKNDRLLINNNKFIVSSPSPSSLQNINTIKNGENTYHITNLYKNLIIRKTNFVINNILYLESNYNINLIFNSYLSIIYNNNKFYNYNNNIYFNITKINNNLTTEDIKKNYKYSRIKSFKIPSKTNVCVGVDLNVNKNIYRFYLTINEKINNNKFSGFKTGFKNQLLDDIYIDVHYNNYCIINKNTIINKNNILFSTIQEYIYETDNNNNQIKKLIKNLYNNFDINFHLTDINSMNMLNKYGNIIYCDDDFNIIEYDKKYINIKLKNNINKIIFKNNVFYNTNTCLFKIEDIIFSKKC